MDFGKFDFSFGFQSFFHFIILGVVLCHELKKIQDDVGFVISHLNPILGQNRDRFSV